LYYDKVLSIYGIGLWLDGISTWLMKDSSRKCFNNRYTNFNQVQTKNQILCLLPRLNQHIFPKIYLAYLSIFHETSKFFCYIVCQGFGLTKQDRMTFWVFYDHFWSEYCFLQAADAVPSSEKNLKPRTKPR